MGKRRKNGTEVIAPKLRNLGYKSYWDYLDSNHWKNFRRTYLENLGLYRCEFCHAGAPLNLHHKTYKRLGNENLDDVVLVCESCHTAIHKYYDADPNVTLPRATDHVRLYGKGCGKKKTKRERERAAWFAGGQPKRRPLHTKKKHETSIR